MIWLANNWRVVLFGVLLLACVSLTGIASHYHSKADDEKARADAALSGLKLANDTISDMHVRQRDVAALDAKYTGELADAKATIDELQRDVDSGKRRLQLNATCSAKSNAPSTSGVDDAASPRLTDAAQRDYFTLRERIEIAGKQIAGLQQYIKEQCLK